MTFLSKDFLIAVILLIFIVSYLFVYKYKKKLNEMRNRNRYLEKKQDEFLANVSHELKTPLTAIKGYTELLQEWSKKELLGEKYKDALEIMIRNEVFLLETLNSILHFSKKQKKITVINKTEQISLKKFTQGIVDSFKVEFRKKELYLHYKIADDVPPNIFVNTQVLRQVLQNLIQNALKFTNDGGVVIEFLYSEEKESLIISVADTGIGISKKSLKRIYEPFFQVESASNRNFGGVGLGLSISRELLGQINGKISVESKEGKGAKFKFQIPIKKVMKIKDEKKEKISRDRFSKNILVVEDSPDSRLLLEAYLHEFLPVGDIQFAENGREAVNLVTKAEKGNQAIDVILMDMQMPIMSGYQATRLLRQRGYKKPIVAITAHDQTQDREKCLSLGCNEYLAKPINLPLFQKTIQKVLKENHVLE